MQVYDSWHGLKEKHNKMVIGLGNFDGLHLGHRKLIGDLVVRAREIGGTPAVLTFTPHPMVVVNPEGAPPMLLSSGAKRKMFAGLGVEVLVLIPFNLEFARLGPEDFVDNVLYRHLGAHTVFVGYNCTFGHMGRGTPDLLRSMGQTRGFGVEVIDPVTVAGRTVSSTLIRNLLAEGDISAVRKLLGYCPLVEGEVIYGERRGNTLGFPTANLEIDRVLLIPANGVYSVKTRVDNDMFAGVANIGVKPTFHDGFSRTVEVHLLDFKGDLYGKHIQVYFIRRLRGERRFPSVGELVEQIRKDIHQARGDACATL